MDTSLKWASPTTHDQGGKSHENTTPPEKSILVKCSGMICFGSTASNEEDKVDDTAHCRKGV